MFTTNLKIKSSIAYYLLLCQLLTNCHPVDLNMLSPTTATGQPNPQQQTASNDPVSANSAPHASRGASMCRNSQGSTAGSQWNGQSWGSTSGRKGNGQSWGSSSGSQWNSHQSWGSTAGSQWNGQSWGSSSGRKGKGKDNAEKYNQAFPHSGKAKDIAFFIDNTEFPLYPETVTLNSLYKIADQIKLSEDPAWKDSYGKINISRCLKGLKMLSAEYPAVQEVLKALADKITDYKEVLKPQQISNSLYGLQNMSAESEAVQKVLKALAAKITDCKEVLNTQAIGNSLYGLKNMSAESEAVKKVLKSLTDKITDCKEILKPQEIGMSLYGLKNMSAESEAVQEVLQNIALKIPVEMDLESDYGFSQILVEFFCNHPGFFSQCKEKNCSFIEGIQSSDILLKKFIKNIKINQDSKNKGCIDLHGLSHFIAEKLLASIDFSQVGRIIFGRSTHKMTNRERMKEIVDNALTQAVLKGTFTLDPENSGMYLKNASNASSS